MSNSVQDPTADGGAKAAAIPMDAGVEKGKGKAPAAEPMDEDDDDSNSEEEAEGEPEEADEDNMEEIDTENIVGSRTRGKNIDFAEAAKNMDEDDEDEEDDDDFQDDDAMED